MFDHSVDNIESLKLKILVNIFNELFIDEENTMLVPGAEEPYYKASTNLSVTNRSVAKIYSRENYLSSALHEISHWLIAGKERRLKNDFGYWYEPEGRSKEQQLAFERVEIKPQAVEWILSLACQQPFHFSADNVQQGLEASESFKQSVTQQAIEYIESGLPKRGQLFLNCLIKRFRDNQPILLNELAKDDIKYDFGNAVTKELEHQNA